MTSLVTPARLPGVYFLPPRRILSEALPPLDVAAFVGYAQRGPLSLPVALEDASQYQDVFGGDVPLARDEHGQVVNAYLPSAVKSFFANGGRRCYAVRVAGPEAASAVFALPGMIDLDATDTPHLALVEASSQGVWANRLRLATRSASRRLVPAAFERLLGSLLWSSGPNAPAIEPGDILRLEDSAGELFLVPISEVAPSQDGSERFVLSTPRAVRVTTRVPAAGDQPAQIERLTKDAPQVLNLQLTFALATPTQVSARVSGPDAASLTKGDWLRLQTGAITGLMQLDDVRISNETLGIPAEPVFVVHAGPLTSLAPGPLTAIAAGDFRSVERLRFDCLLSLADTLYPTLGDLSFGRGGPRFWGDVCLTESSPVFHRTLQGSGAPTAAAGQDTPAQVAAREFRNYRHGVQPGYPVDSVLDGPALAGLLAPLLEEERQAFTHLPLSMATLARDDSFRGHVVPGDDGLASHDAASFLDPSMELVPTRLLLAEAWDRAYVRGQRLSGIHSLLLVDEVAIVAAPDAVHPGWERSDREPTQPPLPLAPPLVEWPCPDLIGPFQQCDAPPVITSVTPNRGTVEGGTLVTINGEGFFGQSLMKVRFGLKTARDIQVLSDTQLTCVTPPATAPALVSIEVETDNGKTTLADAFIYFANASYNQLPLLQRQMEDLSHTALLEIQQALLAACQARQDMTALLSLPLDFERALGIRWQEALRTRLHLPARSRAPELATVADLSYAAVYHPWPLLLDESAPGKLRPVPPDGAVAGMIASREQRRGAWIAPANEVLGDARGLFSDFGADDWAFLFEAQFNVLRHEPLDIRVMSAHTLSDEPELLQLSTRRLLILLRRAVLNRGLDFVFERNNERFRDGIVARLRNLLQGLFERGAFAGSTPQEGYRILADASINPPQSVDAGQLVVLIQVAPSQPAEFITVALTRSDQGTLQVSEV